MIRPSLAIVFGACAWHGAVLGDETQGRVLRHAVFFKFRDSVSQQDVDRVIAEFQLLPSKIAAIVDFEWGVRIRDEGTPRGLSHCFLLTFRDEAGRDAYLPHEDHRAFAAMVGPLLDEVFVIDFWGRAGPSSMRRGVRHAVFFNFRPDAGREDVDAALGALAALPQKIDTIQGLEWGTNNSPEGHDDGFTHAFLVSFDSEDELVAYGTHPAHQALVALLRPVVQNMRVLDYRPQ